MRNTSATAEQRDLVLEIDFLQRHDRARAQMRRIVDMPDRKAKLFLVLLLSGYHGYMASYSRNLARGERTLIGKQLRLLNEVPGIVAALIVILVIVRPI